MTKSTIRPSILKAAAPYSIIVGLLAAALVLPPVDVVRQLPLVLLMLAVSLIPLVFAVIQRVELKDDGGIVISRLFGLTVHRFYVNDITATETDYIFRNGIKGMGAGMALYIRYRKSGSGKTKEVMLGHNIFKIEDVRKIEEFIKNRS